MVVSLDGLMESPTRDLDWVAIDDDFNRYVAGMLNSIDGILLGRVTYEGFVTYWPSSTDAEAPAMNSLPKFVFSKTLETVEWNNSRLIRGDVAQEVTRLKQQPGKDLALFGSATLASAFMRLGLIDEYRLLVNPVVLGKGSPMFRDVTERTKLKLLTAQTLRSGVVLLTYEPT